MWIHQWEGLLWMRFETQILRFLRHFGPIKSHTLASGFLLDQNVWKVKINYLFILKSMYLWDYSSGFFVMQAFLSQCRSYIAIIQHKYSGWKSPRWFYIFQFEQRRVHLWEVRDNLAARFSSLHSGSSSKNWLVFAPFVLQVWCPLKPCGKTSVTLP